MEIRHLAVADRNIADGEARIQRQLALVNRLKVRGRDTGAAEILLGLLRQTLTAWNRERDLIVAALNSELSGRTASSDHAQA